MANQKSTDKQASKSVDQAKVEQKKEAKTDLKKEQKQKKQKKEKKPGLFKKLREAWGELKKTTWPTFGNVVKKTGVVILVVFLFTLVLFGIDFGLGKLYQLFMG